MHTRYAFALFILVLLPSLALCGDAPVNIDFIGFSAECTLTQNGEQYVCINDVKDLLSDEVIMAGGITSQVGVESSSTANFETHQGMRTFVITARVETKKADVQLQILEGDKEVRRQQIVLSLTSGVE
jgi:hypothetical protein